MWPEDGKAEIVPGELRLKSPAGDLPSPAAGEILLITKDRFLELRGLMKANMT
jgi:hypothetical protein